MSEFIGVGNGKQGVLSVLTNEVATQGTLAEMAVDALALTTANEGKRWQATDNDDKIYSYRNPGAGWDYYLDPVPDASGNIPVSGTLTAADSALTFVTYSETGYEYYCEAAVGSALSDSVWQVIREDTATGFFVYAGTGLPAHAATDLATVKALTYTLGA